MQAVLKDGILVWINGADYGYMTSDRYEFVPIPEQDVSSLFQWVEIPEDPSMSHWELIGTFSDLTLIFPTDALPHSEHIAKLKAVNIGNVRPATVTRRFWGLNYDIDCFVSQDVKDKYQSGAIIIGDYLTVSFISEYPDGDEKNIPVVTGKVWKSWP